MSSLVIVLVNGIYTYMHDTGRYNWIYSSSTQCNIVAVRELTTTQFYSSYVYSTIFYQPVVHSFPPGDIFKYRDHFLVLYRHPP